MQTLQGARAGLQIVKFLQAEADWGLIARQWVCVAAWRWSCSSQWQYVLRHALELTKHLVATAVLRVDLGRLNWQGPQQLGVLCHQPSNHQLSLQVRCPVRAGE